MEHIYITVNNFFKPIIAEKLNLYEYAQYHNILIYKNGNLDKGWKGNVIEHMLNIKKNNNQSSDIVDLEIKTVPVLIKNNQYKPKETTCLSVINTEDSIKNTFSTSSLFKKINKTMFVLINVEDKNHPYICDTVYFNIMEHSNVFNILEQDYNTISEHMLSNIQNDLPIDLHFNGHMGQYLQVRPKTGKNKDYTWAYFFKSILMTQIINNKIS